ncbi:LysR substrate-binding domain-containing protein [Hyphomonas jannaschiana]|uniref:LysR substrate-binding domain-containing protein n=1 Tax=Hyphomonas jannaschiana TaxID=86 RepID=UPI0009DF7B2D|nr:LysR substrate-binding domain-containing protein [Hyphomonas jannaschiana]
MRPTLRQLQYIVAVADTGRFRDAALQLGVSQPSLSEQISDAEAQLGVTLIERARTGAVLTPAGVEVVRRARIVLTQVEDLKTVARQVTGDLAGRYRLGTLPTIGPYLLPSAVRELHQLYPDLRLGVREERTIDLDEKLNDGRLDMVISTAEDHLNSESMQLFDEQLYVCTASDDPIGGGNGALKISALKGREVLSLGYGHRLSTVVQKLAEAAGAHVSTEYEGTSLDAIRQMAGMGAGVAIVPSLYAVMEASKDPHQIVRPIDHPLARRRISLVWRAGSPLEQNIQKLGLVFRDVAADLLDQGTKTRKGKT